MDEIYERKVFIHIPKCGGRAVEHWLSDSQCSSVDKLDGVRAREVHTVREHLRAHGLGYYTKTTPNADVAIAFNEVSKRPDSPLYPIINVFVVRGEDGKLRSVWSVHGFASAFPGMDMFTITREPLSRLRSSLEYLFSECESDASLWSPDPKKWQTLDKYQVPPETVKNTFKIWNTFIAENDMFVMPASTWLEKKDGGLVEQRYDLHTEHAKCLADLAGWLKVPPPATEIKANMTTYKSLKSPLEWGASSLERILDFYSSDYEKLGYPRPQLKRNP